MPSGVQDVDARHQGEQDVRGERFEDKAYQGRRGPVSIWISPFQ